MHDEYKRTDPSQIAYPGKAHKDNCGYVMNKHLPEVLSLHIKELGKAEWPVKCHGYHVIPPYVTRYWMIGVIVITVINIPQPWFVP